MALFNFDYYDQTDVPTFSLANPDGTIIYSLGTIYDRKLELRYNTLSKLTFTAPSQINGVATDYYNFLQYRRLVYVDGIANFMISNVEIENDGIIEMKHVTCESLETILNYKKVTLFAGQYYFYKPEAPSVSLLDNLLAYIPGWTLGTVDSSLMNMNRRFDISDKTLYDFMVNEVSQTFQCIFVFDSINKVISVYTTDNASTETDIFISFDNLMESFTIQESTNELVTALNVLGGEDLSINTVNPLGTNTIYNFDYYKTTEWMTQDLIDALDVWEQKIGYYQPTYAENLTIMKNETYELTVYQTTLVDLQGQLVAANTAKDALIKAGESTTTIDATIASLQSQISSMQSTIASQQILVNTYRSILASINGELLFENNFTPTQLASLDNFIIGNTYTNTNFITGSSTEQTQEQAQALYDQARGTWDSVNAQYTGGVIAKVSQPRYTFDIDTANFLFIKDFEPFIEQVSLGCSITIQLTETTTTEAVLLGIDFNYDNPTEFKMILSNRLRLSDEQFQYSDLFGSVVNSSTTTEFNSQKWSNMADSYSDLTGTPYKVVLSSGQASGSHLCLFYGDSGSIIRDGGAVYVPPTKFTTRLSCVNATFTEIDYANYSLIGRECFFQLGISLSGSSGSGTGQLYIQMPVFSTSNSGVNAVFPVTSACVSLGTAYPNVVAILEPASNTAGLYKWGASTGLFPVTGSMVHPTLTRFYISGNYMIA